MLMLDEGSANVGGSGSRGAEEHGAELDEELEGRGETTGEAMAMDEELRESPGESPAGPPPNAARLAVYQRRAELSRWLQVRVLHFHFKDVLWFFNSKSGLHF